MILAPYLPDSLPYLTFLACILGVVWRVARWCQAPAAPVSLFPVPPSPAARCRRLAAEVCLLRGAHASDPWLWIGAWPLHVALALLAVGHIRAFVDFPRLWQALGLTPADVDTLASISGGAVGLVAVAACLYLLARRALVKRVREITRAEDVLTLLVLLAVILSGDLMRFGPRVDLPTVRAYFVALASLHPVPMPDVPGFATHFLLVQLLALWAPWSKLMHMPGLFLAKATLSR